MGDVFILKLGLIKCSTRVNLNKRNRGAYIWLNVQKYLKTMTSGLLAKKNNSG